MLLGELLHLCFVTGDLGNHLLVLFERDGGAGRLAEPLHPVDDREVAVEAVLEEGELAPAFAANEGEGLRGLVEIAYERLLLV